MEGGGYLHGAVKVGFGNVQRCLHNLVETVVGHVPCNEQLGSWHVIQLSVHKKNNNKIV